MLGAFDKDLGKSGVEFDDDIQRYEETWKHMKTRNLYIYIILYI